MSECRSYQCPGIPTVCHHQCMRLSQLTQPTCKTIFGGAYQGEGGRRNTWTLHIASYVNMYTFSYLKYLYIYTFVCISQNTRTHNFDHFSNVVRLKGQPCQNHLNADKQRTSQRSSAMKPYINDHRWPPLLDLSESRQVHFLTWYQLISSSYLHQSGFSQNFWTINIHQ